MNILTALLAQPRIFTGHGTNHEGEAFVGRMEIQALIGSSALMLHYSATGMDGKHLHGEATLLGNSQDGKLCLWPVMEELPLVLPHPEVSRSISKDGELAVVFASGPHEMREIFREEITIQLHANGELTYAHSWGMPGGEFQARSSCVLFPSK
jgi:hypothetical protein